MSRRSSPPAPQEDPSVVIARNRQVRDLAELDEEENERLKAAFATRRGTRAFRNRRSTRSGGGSVGSTETKTRAFAPSSPRWEPSGSR